MPMTNLRYLGRLIFLALTLCLTLGCREKEDDDSGPEKPPVIDPVHPGENEVIKDTTLSLSMASVFFAKEGGKQSIIVTTNAPAWTAVSDQAWCHTSQNGTELIVEAGKNPDLQLRSATVTVKVTGSRLEQRISIVQSAGEEGKYITPTRATVRVPSSGSYGVYAPGLSEMPILVQTNLTDWTCRVDQDWCEVRCDAGNVYIRVAPHESMQERRAVVTLSHGGLDYAQILVIQMARTSLQLAFPDGTSLPVSGGTIRVKVYTNISDWSATPASADCWFSLTKTDDETLTLTATRRQGSTPRPPQQVTITAEKDSETFVIYETSSVNEGYGYGDVTPWDE